MDVSSQFSEQRSGDSADIGFSNIYTGGLELQSGVFYAPERVRALQRRFLRITLLLSAAVVVVLFLVSLLFDWHFQDVWRLEAAGLIGASVGTAELISRYRDAPAFALICAPGVTYVAINAAASVTAMGIIIAFDWSFGATGDPVAVTQVLVAGFGAMALFRSSLLTVKAGSDDIGIGPSSLLSILMASSDRAVDRLRAADRAGRVYDAMQNVSYEKAKHSLPDVAVALMQNLSPADAAALDVTLDGLESSKKELPDNTKALLLGLKITDLVSTEVLIAAKRSLGDSILCQPVTAKKEKKSGDPNGHRDRDRTDSLVDALPLEPISVATPDLPQTPQTPDRPS